MPGFLFLGSGDLLGISWTLFLLIFVTVLVLENWFVRRLFMMKRRKMSRGYSKKLFSRRADSTHRKNFMSSSGSGPMRGGIRL